MTVEVGVTASRGGLTLAQIHHAGPRLRQLAEEAGEQPVLHHGCCVGGDQIMHELARASGYRIVGHPPVDQRLMAENLDCDVWMDPLPYVARNHAIVDRCTELWGFPSGVTERMRGSGTWATIRYAALLPREGSIIYPDGTPLKLVDWVQLR